MSKPDRGPAEPWPYTEADRHGWPTEADCSGKEGYDAELCKAKLEVRKKRTDQEIERARADLDAQIAARKVSSDADIAIEKSYYDAVLEVAKGTIDRARGSGETVQKAAAAIVTLYTGVLALAFSVGDNPLPAKALFAAISLGVAIFLSTAFLAYLPDADKESRQDPIRPKGPIGERLTETFVRWTRTAARERAALLRGSVIALAAAVALMPAPFVSIGEAKGEVGKSPAWPTPDPASGADTELSKILYTAQVAEVAEERRQPVARGNDDEVWTAGFVVAMLSVLWVVRPGFLRGWSIRVGSSLPQRRERSRGRDTGAP
jgi:hypothetical protein